MSSPTLLLASTSPFASADLLTWPAYLAILALLWCHARRPATSPRTVFALLALFVGSAGAAQVLGAVTDAAPGHWLRGAAEVAAAAVAWGVALALLRLLRRAGDANRGGPGPDLERLRLLEAAVAASGDGVMIAAATEGPGVSIVYANPAFERMTGYTAAEAVGRSPSMLRDQDAEPAAIEAVRDALRGADPVRVEVPSRRKDGTRLWAEWAVVPVPDAAGRLTHRVAVLRDTTGRRRAEQAVRESEARFRGLFEQAADAIFLLTPHGRILDANRRACESLGYTPEELMALDLADVEAAAPGDTTPGSRDQTMTMQVRHRRKDGTTFPVEVRVGGLEAGGRRLTLAIVRDVSRRRQAEEALRRSEALLRLVWDSAADGMRLTDAAGTVRMANAAYCRMVGRPAAEVVGRSMADAYDPARRDEILRKHRERFAARTARTHFESAVALWDGRRRWFDVATAYFDAPGDQPLQLSVVRDVTDRKQAEESLRASERHLRAVIETTPECVKLVAPDGTLLEMNPAGLTMLEAGGLDDVRGRCVFDVIAPEDRDAFRALHGRVCGGEAGTLEYDIIGLNGARRRVETQAAPLPGPNGATLHLGITRDVTDRKRLEDQVRQAQKMEAVGQLAGGVAHDFNNLLTVIRGNADLLRTPPPGAANPAELLDEVRLAADRAAVLVRQLLMFSRRQPSRPEVVDLNAVVADLAGMLRRLLGERVAVETALAPRPVTVLADRGHLEQVVMNLAVNARDAMPDGGVLTISTAAVEADASPPVSPPARSARLAVADTGTGMSPEVRARIFEPFFTTKGPDKGTGLGLATVFGIVKHAGGRVEVDTAPGAGTTFRVDLPFKDATPSPSTVISLRDVVSRQPAGGGRSVLLVEDEDGVRKFARYALEGQGYAVAEAGDGEAALGLLAPGRPLDLLVTDLTMPGMDGRELAARVRAARPDVGVVFVSGYVPDDGHLDRVPGAVFLPKPYTPADLLRAADKALPRAGERRGRDPHREAVVAMGRYSGGCGEPLIGNVPGDRQ